MHRAALAAAGLFLICPAESRAQGGIGSPEVSALTREVQATRKSVDELTTVLKTYLAEAGHRERVTVLLRRIEVAEQQAANVASELRTLRAQLAQGEQGVQASRNRLGSARSMQTLAPADANTVEALQQEQTHALAQEELSLAAVQKLQPRVAELESELAARRAAIRALEAQLEKELRANAR